MKTMIVNWKNFLLVLLTVIVVVQSCRIVDIHNRHRADFKAFNEAIQKYYKNHIDPYDAFATSSQAQGCLHAGKLKDALAWSNFMIELLPEGYSDPSWLKTMYTLRGDVYYAMGDYGKAIEDYSFVINLNAEDIVSASLRFPNLYIKPVDDVFVKRANAFRSLRETKSAVKDFCDGILFSKDLQDRTRNKPIKAVLPPLPDDLLEYLEEHRDMIEDKDKFKKCIQILKQWE